MIFNWEEKFSEELSLNGIDLEDDVEYINRSINLLSGCVIENDEEYWVYIELDDNFEIKSLECDCGKAKCHHMTALLHAENFKYHRDIEFEELVDDLDNNKLKMFIKDQLSFNEEFQEAFADEFRNDFIKDDEFSLEDKLFLILDYYDWQSLITDYVENDLVKSYDDGYYSETFYLISAMFDEVINDITYNPETELKKCYSVISKLLKKLSKTKPELIRGFLKHCIEHDYLNMYPQFRKLLGDLKDVL